MTRPTPRTALLLVALLAAPLAVGCGGGDEAPPAPPVSDEPTVSRVGVYTGTFTVSEGPSAGATGPFTLTVAEDGTATGSVTDADGLVGSLTGTADLSSGSFTLTGTFDATGTTGTITGSLPITATGVTGTGEFELTNDNAGTVTLTKP